MVERKIIWTLRSVQDRISIYEYWLERNKSEIYPKKLDKLFKAEIKRIIAHPFSGVKTRKANVRVKFIKSYHLVYRIFDAHIEIITIWDSRRNPNSRNIDRTD